MNCLSAADKLDREIKKHRDAEREAFGKAKDAAKREREPLDEYFAGMADETGLYDEIAGYNRAKKLKMAELALKMELAAEISEKFADILRKRGGTREKQTWHITVRPDPTLVDCATFAAMVDKYLCRREFEWYFASLEQKGTSLETLGDGFHVHMVVKSTNMRSVAEILRGMKASFLTIAKPSAIQVDNLRRSSDVKTVVAYQLAHASHDGHKEPTQEWDAKWRDTLDFPWRWDTIPSEYKS